MNEPIKIKSEDGYTFYRLADGRYADSFEEKNIDMSWNSFIDITTSFHEQRIGYCVYFSQLDTRAGHRS
ncbi:MAG: hypothetical protein QX191_02705 [Methylococcaceae bacterium]